MPNLSFASSFELTEANWRKLNAGKVLVFDAKNEQGIDGVIGVFIAEASAEEIWHIFTDYDNFMKTFKGIKDMGVNHEDENGAEVWFKIKAVLSFNYTLYRHYEVPQQRITWKKLKGDFKVISGSWEIHPTVNPNQQLIVYESFVKIGFVVPTKMVRNGAAKEFTKTVERIRQRLLSN